MDWEERKQRSQDLSMRLLSFPFHMSVLYEFSACSALSGLLMMFLQGVIPHHSFEWDLVWSSPCTGITQCSLPALTPGSDALHPAEVHPAPQGSFCSRISLLQPLVLVREWRTGHFGDPVPPLPSFPGLSAHSEPISEPRQQQCGSCDGKEKQSYLR